MKVGDRKKWRMIGTMSAIEVELIRREQVGWWSVQPIGRSTTHYAHISELHSVAREEATMGTDRPCATPDRVNGPGPLVQPDPTGEAK